MNGELLVISDVSRKLIEYQIPFMLTGSIAMNYFVEPRMTRDIDLVIHLKEENIPLIVKMFEKDNYIDEGAIKWAIENNHMFNIIHNETVTKVDFILRKSNEHRLLEFERRQQIQFLNIKTYIVSLEDLIISKLYWIKDSKSDLQKRDILLLLASSYETHYVEKWSKNLGLESILEEIKDG
jgi:hypothetical protein